MNSTSDFYKENVKSLKSFRHAFNGLSEAASTQPNFRFHLGITVVVIAVGFFLKIALAEWCLLILAAGFVMALECFNTAIEYLTNLVSPQYNPQAGKVKDIAAAGVFISSIVAAAIGLMVFLPKII